MELDEFGPTTLAGGLDAGVIMPGRGATILTATTRPCLRSRTSGLRYRRGLAAGADRADRPRRCARSTSATRRSRTEGNEAMMNVVAPSRRINPSLKLFPERRCAAVSARSGYQAGARISSPRRNRYRQLRCESPRHSPNRSSIGRIGVLCRTHAHRGPGGQRQPTCIASRSRPTARYRLARTQAAPSTAARASST